MYYAKVLFCFALTTIKVNDTPLKNDQNGLGNSYTFQFCIDDYAFYVSVNC